MTNLTIDDLIERTRRAIPARTLIETEKDRLAARGIKSVEEIVNGKTQLTYVLDGDLLIATPDPFERKIHTRKPLEGFDITSIREPHPGHRAINFRIFDGDPSVLEFDDRYFVLEDSAVSTLGVHGITHDGYAFTYDIGVTQSRYVPEPDPTVLDRLLRVDTETFQLMRSDPALSGRLKEQFRLASGVRADYFSFDGSKVRVPGYDWHEIL